MLCVCGQPRLTKRGIILFLKFCERVGLLETWPSPGSTWWCSVIERFEFIKVYMWKSDNRHYNWKFNVLAMKMTYLNALLSHSSPQSLRSPWPAVGKPELWVQPFWNNKLNWTEFCPSGSLHSLHMHLWRMPEMVSLRALVFRPLVKENEDPGNEF